MATRPSILVQFCLLATTWGASFLFVEVALQGMGPTYVVWGRLTLGAAVLAVVCAAARVRLPRRPSIWGHLAVVSLLLCVAPFLLFAWAQQDISSGLASIYNAATPLMTMLIALAALREEKLTRWRLAGLLLGFVGVVVVLGPWTGVGASTLLAQVACLLATVSYGAAFVYLRRFVSPHRLPSLAVATVQVGLGSLATTLLLPFIGTGRVTLSAPVVISIVLLGGGGTGLAYVWNTNIVQAWGATDASTVTYLTPVVGVTLGVVVLAEGLTWNQPVGASVVVLGIAAGQERFVGITTRWREAVSRRRPASASADDWST